MSGPFSIGKIDDACFEVVESETGQVVKESPDDPHFCRFLSWASTEDQPIHAQFYNFRGRGHYFNDIELLVEHLKHAGMILYVSWVGAKYERSIVAEGEQNLGRAQCTFVNLPKAVQWPEDPEFEFSGFGGKNRLGFGSEASGTWVTKKLLEQMNEQLRDDRTDIRRVSSFPIIRSFVYFDVSDFSTKPGGHQALIINSIAKAVEDDPLWYPVPVARKTKSAREALMCIGDGYIFVFRCPLDATFFAAYLAYVIQILLAKGKLPVEFHYRVGVHMGRVFSFYDPGRKDWNYIGDGINGGQRVLGAIGKHADDIVFISAEVRQAIVASGQPQEYPDILGNSLNRGRRLDKHGNAWRVYELNHTSLMAQYNESLDFKNW